MDLLVFRELRIRSHLELIVRTYICTNKNFYALHTHTQIEPHTNCITSQCFFVTDVFHGSVSYRQMRIE